MTPKDEDLPILQNLEFTIAQLWRAHPEMTDYTALRVYESAFQWYRSESRGATPKPATFSGLDGQALEALMGTCEFLLGRRALEAAEGEKVGPVPLEQLVACLRELGKSVERHTQMSGRRGYLTFIDKYVL